MEHRIKVVCERPRFFLALSSSSPHPGWGELTIPTRYIVPVAGVSAGNGVVQGVRIQENGRGAALQGT